jgi:hypothetical protein
LLLAQKLQLMADTTTVFQWRQGKSQIFPYFQWLLASSGRAPEFVI